MAKRFTRGQSTSKAPSFSACYLEHWFIFLKKTILKLLFKSIFLEHPNMPFSWGPIVINYPCQWLQPRTYPPRFGLKIAKLLHRFQTKRVAMPDMPEPAGSGFELFSRIEWDDWWMCANMKSVFAYLRGSHDLDLREWRALFPTEI